MTNQLPVYFAIMKPVLPQVCTRYVFQELNYMFLYLLCLCLNKIIS